MSRLPLAKEIMVTKLVTVSPDDDFSHGIRLLLRHRLSGAPVIDSERRYFGLFSDRGCMKVLYEKARDAGVESADFPRARELMTKKLLTLSPETDAIEAISTLLKQRFSGAPVVDEDQRFLGVFSERYIMRLLINSAYEQVPSTRVVAFMNTDRGRLIDETTDFLEVTRMFLDTYYRRLGVLKDGKLVGQISRQDALTAEHDPTRAKGRRRGLLDPRRERILADEWHRGGELPSMRISDFMNTSAETIEEELDLLAIARIFLDSNRRRLPVLREGKLVGQISRRDLLLKVLDLLSEQPHRDEQPGLFLSAVTDAAENPILRDSHHPGDAASKHRS